MDEYLDRLKLLDTAVTTGAETAMEFFRSECSEMDFNKDPEASTHADREVQQKIVKIIDKEFSDDVIVAEEGEAQKELPETDITWVIDPIDGTGNFLRGSKIWATSIALVAERKVIAAVNMMPALNDIYKVTPNGVFRNDTHISVSNLDNLDKFVIVPVHHWPKKSNKKYQYVLSEIMNRFGHHKRLYSTQYTLSLVADGVIEGAITNRQLRPWDTLAGVEMIRAAGGTVTNKSGERWHSGVDGLVASNGKCHDELVEIFKD